MVSGLVSASSTRPERSTAASSTARAILARILTTRSRRPQSASGGSPHPGRGTRPPQQCAGGSSVAGAGPRRGGAGSARRRYADEHRWTGRAGRSPPSRLRCGPQRPTRRPRRAPHLVALVPVRGRVANRHEPDRLVVIDQPLLIQGHECGAAGSTCRCCASRARHCTGATPISRCTRALTRSHHAQQASASSAKLPYPPSRFAVVGTRSALAIFNVCSEPPLAPDRMVHTSRPRSRSAALRLRCRGGAPALSRPGRSLPSSNRRSADTSRRR